jgi:Flp pilus assembly protein TadD
VVVHVAMKRFAHLRLTPANAAAHNNRGLALVRENRVAEAVGEFRAALALAPNISGGSQNLARVLSIMANQAPNGSDMSFLR